MAKKIFDAVATTGEYKTSSGETRKRYVTVGAVFENDKKQMSLKIESLPVGGEWNGWVSFFVPKDAAQKKQEQNRNSSGVVSDFEDDIIPF